MELDDIVMTFVVVVPITAIAIFICEFFYGFILRIRSPVSYEIYRKLPKVIGPFTLGGLARSLLLLIYIYGISLVAVYCVNQEISIDDISTPLAVSTIVFMIIAWFAESKINKAQIKNLEKKF